MIVLSLFLIWVELSLLGGVGLGGVVFVELGWFVELG